MPAKKIGPAPAEANEKPISIRSIDRQEEMLWVAGKPLDPSAFPPCIKAIIALGRDEKNEIEEKKNEPQAEPAKEKKRGKHRTAAILAAFLGQAGYSRDSAKRLWLEAASVEERIFEDWFARMHCPKCRALQRQSKGYPDMGIADLQLCRPDEICPGFEGPVEYACRIAGEDDRKSGSLQHIKTRHIVHFLDWATGQEGEIELTEEEKGDLDRLLEELAEKKDMILTYARVKMRGRLRPKFYLREREGPRRQMLSDII